MKPFIFQERNGIYIIDLALTVQRLRETYDVVKQLAREGKSSSSSVRRNKRKMSSAKKPSAPARSS